MSLTVLSYTQVTSSPLCQRALRMPQQRPLVRACIADVRDCDLETLNIASYHCSTCQAQRYRSSSADALARLATAPASRQHTQAAAAVAPAAQVSSRGSTTTQPPSARLPSVWRVIQGMVSAGGWPAAQEQVLYCPYSIDGTGRNACSPVYAGHMSYACATTLCVRAAKHRAACSYCHPLVPWSLSACRAVFRASVSFNITMAHQQRRAQVRGRHGQPLRPPPLIQAVEGDHHRARVQQHEGQRQQRCAHTPSIETWPMVCMRPQPCEGGLVHSLLKLYNVPLQHRLLKQARACCVQSHKRGMDGAPPAKKKDMWGHAST